MPKYKNTEFTESAKKHSFDEFSKVFANHFTEDEMKEAYNVAQGKDGDIKRTVKSSKKTKSNKDK